MKEPSFFRNIFRMMYTYKRSVYNLGDAINTPQFAIHTPPSSLYNYKFDWIYKLTLEIWFVIGLFHWEGVWIAIYGVLIAPP